MLWIFDFLATLFGEPPRARQHHDVGGWQAHGAEHYAEAPSLAPGRRRSARAAPTAQRGIVTYYQIGRS